MRCACAVCVLAVCVLWIHVYLLIPNSASRSSVLGWIPSLLWYTRQSLDCRFSSSLALLVAVLVSHPTPLFSTDSPRL
ncbi:hypothetical protein BZA05DRAFT_412614 [Tricharina praecox]|uniref:uncharacterized protein n=1 Tax=Tricharina praecox TaxID=43433 RepID=UPI00221ECE41|nr:uncharacterized protein BZA05DRAFT_412614 [Tricharina praecox]KAI5842020.1 hypothetical protein BZA05DRAFT_412614 [Tricharina praecox]